MSDLQSSNKPGLTKYNVDGLELHFTVDRKVRATQSAMARMCNIPETTMRDAIKAIAKNGTILDVIQAQTSSTGGGKESRLHASGTIKILLKIYNPERLEQFLDFGIDEGLAQMAGVPATTVTRVPNGYVIPKTSELLAIASQLAKEDENRQSFLVNKPGLKAMDDLAKSDKALALPASKFIVKELAEEFGLVLNRMQASGVSAMLTVAVMTQNLERPTKRLVKSAKGKSGHSQSYYVNEYSYDIKSVAIDCMKHMKLI